MLESAKQSDWDGVTRFENTCSVLINELRLQSQGTELTREQRQEKTRIMQSILRNDAQLRVLAEPWLATLEHMGRVPASSALH
ncbi:flagellar protein FliT [Comamonas jiangduensis]|uniref:flagellar protein FliT n=1 Tax=Comamonas jiangduensis TaxID=1194168 RepID=UPI003BF840E5